MTTLSYKHMGSLLVFSALLLPSMAFASTVYVDTQRSEFFVGDTILFSVRVDSEGKSINAIDGQLQLDHAADVASLTDITTSGSIFSLWPRNPVPSERNTRISFAGGAPGGFVSKDAVIFNAVLTLHKEGKIALSPSAIGVYLHDGEGTKDEVQVKDLTIDVLPKKAGAESTNDLSLMLTSDTTAPEPFEIYVGQESSVFDGKKFLSFGTTDAHSGISYYEVQEGNLPPTRSNNTYVLQEQFLTLKVVVTAYDSAGNSREAVYDPAPQRTFPTVPVGIGLLVVILLFIISRKVRTSKK